MSPRIANARGFIGIISILLVLGIVGFLYFVILTPSRTKPVIENSHIDTSTYQSILKSTTSEVKRLEQLQLDRAQQLDIYKISGE